MKLLSFFCALSVVLAGCSKQEAPPPPVAVEQAPAKLEEVFKENKGQAVNNDVQILLDDALASLKAKDFGKAVFALQTLLGRSDLTSQQRETASSAMLAANKALADQAAAGDRRAQEALQIRRATK